MLSRLSRKVSSRVATWDTAAGGRVGWRAGGAAGVSGAAGGVAGVINRVPPAQETRRLHNRCRKPLTATVAPCWPSIRRPPCDLVQLSEVDSNPRHDALAQVQGRGANVSEIVGCSRRISVAGEELEREYCPQVFSCSHSYSCTAPSARARCCVPIGSLNPRAVHTLLPSPPPPGAPP